MGTGEVEGGRIAAFNLGNALGAWLGGAVIDHGPGLGAIAFVAALLPLSGFALAFWALRTTPPDREGGTLVARPAE